MKKVDYYLGLDIGTDSVGFAVTDENYNVIKKGNKSIIGTRLFEEGKTAAERRVFRSNRRRILRTRQKIELLRSLFEEEINKVDNAFFQRLDESVYHKEDKTVEGYNTLFNDKTFIDKNYYKKYLTIYHLRKALINGEIDDVRLLYLGLAHIIKNRGHFLFHGQEFNNITDFSVSYNAFDKFLKDKEEEEEKIYSLNISDVNKLEEKIKDKSKTLTQKEKEICSLIDGKATPEQKSIIKLMLGASVSLSKLFVNLDDELEKAKVEFKGDYEKFTSDIAPKLDDNIVLIELAKAIYDWSVLKEILDCPNSDSNATLSDAKIYKYKTHKENLKLLKDMVKEYIPDEYKEIFKKENLKTNYPAYVGVCGKNLIIKEKRCSQEVFSKYISGKFEKIELQKENELKLMEDIKLSNAFPKQRSKDNSVIPYQVHKTELDLILKNNADTFPFLKAVEDDITVAQKIQSIFMYRIPYYVGPLNKHSDFSWIVKNKEKSNEKIKPWNFEKVINIEESAEKFIRKMTNKCTYLKNEDVLPKKSLLYSKYALLNELNNLKIDGNSISVELKQDLFENLFKNQMKVTKKRLISYLKEISFIEKGDKPEITGIDNDFANNLESYIKFKDVLGEPFDENMAEDIIKWITIFPDDKKMLKRKISSVYTIEENKLNKICNFKFSGWGRFSKKFLTEIESEHKNTGEKINIINAMYNTNLNLMQLLSNEYDYIKEINKQLVTKDDITLEDIKELYCSPAVKKSIWQAVKIVKEIEKVMGRKPLKLFIEMTRAEGEKVRTTSRHRELMKKYENFKKEYKDIYEKKYKNIHEQLKGKNEADLRQKKLFLYFSQLGKCAYTDVPIEIEDLPTNLYDIEHIYPRSKTKDDSIHNNLVLVKRIANAEKDNIYPIPTEYRQPQLWKMLREKDLINKTKYDRLMSTTELSAEELKGFIARQLVETSQASKAVATLFNDYYDGTKSKVVYVKAGNVTDFRKHFDIIKVRDLNDYHHAHDAYLNIVVGNVWDTKFTDKFYSSFSKDTSKYTLKPEFLYPTNRKKYGDYAWVEGENGTIKTVKDTIKNSHILFTRKSYKATGQLFDLLHAKKNAKGKSFKLAIKTSNPRFNNLDKYGSYKSMKPSHYVLVEYKKGKKYIRELISIPIFIKLMLDHKPNAVRDWIKREIKTDEFKIYNNDIKINSLIKGDGYLFHLSGGKDIKNAIQLLIDIKYHAYLKRVYKCVDRKYILKQDKIEKEINIEIYDLLISKLENGIYSKIKRHKILGEFLVKNRDVFINLEMLEQLNALVQIISIFSCKAGSADLRLIGGVERANRITISLNITNNFEQFVLINQSITGLYEDRINLLDENIFKRG